MISMLIADGYAKERRAISLEAHEQAARHTEEYWKWLECADERELKALIEQDPRLQLACMDITMQDAVEMAKQVPTLESEADLQEKASETHRRAIPGYTAAELADKAKKAGDSPDVVKDDVTEITLFDYSDILDSDQGSK